MIRELRQGPPKLCLIQVFAGSADHDDVKEQVMIVCQHGGQANADMLKVLSIRAKEKMYMLAANYRIS